MSKENYTYDCTASRIAYHEILTWAEFMQVRQTCTMHCSSLGFAKDRPSGGGH